MAPRGATEVPALVFCTAAEADESSRPSCRGLAPCDQGAEAGCESPWRGCCAVVSACRSSAPIAVGAVAPTDRAASEACAPERDVGPWPADRNDSHQVFMSVRLQQTNRQDAQ